MSAGRVETRVRLFTGEEGLLRFMRLGVLLAGTVPLAFLAAVASSTYDDAMRAAEGSLDGLTQAAEMHARRVMERNDVVLQQISRLLKDDDDAAVQARERELRELARAILVRLPQLGSLSVRDGEGRLLVSTLPFPFPASHRTGVRNDSSEGGRGEPRSVLIDPITGEAQLRITRPRPAAPGKPTGVVELTVSSSHFTEFYRQLTNGGSRASAAILTEEGFVLASWPPELGATALPPDSSLVRAAKGPSGWGIVRSDVLAPGDRRHAVFRRVAEHPLFVVAFQDRAAITAGWKRHMLVLSAIVVPITLALVLASWLALLRTRREMEARLRLEREAEQRRMAEEALRHAQKLDALGQLAGGLAHDFANLLTVVSNSAELLKQAIPSAAARPELATMLRAVRSGSALTGRLLAFSRRQTLSPEVLDPATALADMLEMLQTTAGRGVTVQVRVAADTPQIEVDRAELQMALINLVANARDAVGQQGSLTVHGRRGSSDERPERHPLGYAVISVSDHGPGMSGEVQDRAFEPFFTTKPAGSGTGLGLSQVYGFCKQAGGGVEIRSDLGIGTTVSMFLPASGKTAAAMHKPTAETERLSARLSGRTVH